MTTTTDKKTADRLKKQEEYANNNEIFADIYNRIGKLEQKLAPNNNNNDNKPAYHKNDFNEQDNYTGAYRNEEFSILYPSSCPDPSEWMSVKTHTKFMYEKDKRIRELEDKVHDLLNQCSDINDLATNVLHKNGIFD